MNSKDGLTYKCRWVQVRMFMLPARACPSVQYMQLQVSISPSVSNTSFGCPLFSLHFFPSTFLQFSDVCCSTFFLTSNSLSDLRSSLGTSVVQRQFDSPLSGHSPCPLQSSRRIFHASFMCLTECILAFSMLLFATNFCSLYSFTLSACC